MSDKISQDEINRMTVTILQNFWLVRNHDGKTTIGFANGNYQAESFELHVSNGWELMLIYPATFNSGGHDFYLRGSIIMVKRENVDTVLDFYNLRALVFRGVKITHTGIEFTLD